MSREHPIPWLKELHSKIWNREDLKATLFRKVEVTRAHYDALQDSLNQKHPDRVFEEYNSAFHNVLSDKLDILKLTTPAEALSPRHPDNSEDRVDDDDDLEASNEDDSEINSLFPFTLSYLDLSTLELKNESYRFPSPLFLRQEYDHISELINNMPRSNKGSVIISGQPGTGKTAYLYLKIIESLIAGRPSLYQTREGYVYHVSQKGVEAIWSYWSPKTHYVAFVDGDKENSEPEYSLFDPLVQIIVASFPKGTYQRWIKQASPNTIITKLATSLWSPHELFLTGIFLFPWDITFKLLRKSTLYFGYNPRQCFDACHSVTRLETKTAEAMAQIGFIAIDTSHIFQALCSYKMGDDALTDTIFQLSPTNELRRFEECHYEAVSRWVFDSLLAVCETHEAHAAAKLHRKLSRTRWAGVAQAPGPFVQEAGIELLE